MSTEIYSNAVKDDEPLEYTPVLENGAIAFTGQGRVPRVGGVVFRDSDIGTRQLVARDGSEIQQRIDEINNLGGGIVFLKNGIYNMPSDIRLYSNITLEGETGGGVIIDFQGNPYQIKAQGNGAFSTGTVSISNDSTTVTGTGTDWTLELEGRFIFLRDHYYEVSSVDSSTSITIANTYSGTADISGGTYIIANTVDGVSLINFTVKNSTNSSGAIFFRYTSFPFFEGVTAADSTLGIKVQDTDILTSRDFEVIDCESGFVLDQVGITTLNSFNINDVTVGDALSCSKLVNSEISNFTTNNAAGSGMVFDTCSDTGVIDFSCASNSSYGIRLVNNDTFNITVGTISDNNLDGVKFVGNSNFNIINTINFEDSGGYGINVSESGCDNNVLTGNTFTGNVSGAINDSGTGTMIN